MRNLHKSKEQLSTVEERLKSAAVEAQKAQMDLMAKKGECGRLEEQVGLGGRAPTFVTNFRRYGYMQY